MTLDLRGGCPDCRRWSIAGVAASRPSLRPAVRPCPRPHTIRGAPRRPVCQLQGIARPHRRLLQPVRVATSEDAEQEEEEDWSDDFALMQSVAQGLQIDPERPSYHVLAAEGGWLNVSAALTTPPHVLLHSVMRDLQVFSSAQRLNACACAVRWQQDVPRGDTAPLNACHTWLINCCRPTRGLLSALLLLRPETFAHVLQDPNGPIYHNGMYHL